MKRHERSRLSLDFVLQSDWFPRQNGHRLMNFNDPSTELYREIYDKRMKRHESIPCASSPTVATAAWVSYVSGMSSGVAASAMGHPFDTVRVIMQTSTAERLSATQCVRSIYQTSGVTGLYRGLRPQVCQSIVTSALLFGIYASTKEKLVSHARSHPKSVVGRHFQKENSVSTGAAAGAVTGLMLSGLLSPLEFIKCQQQLSMDAVPSVRSIVQRNIEKYGVRSLYTGASATIVRQIFGNMFFFGTYEFCKQKFTTPDQAHVSPLAMLASGSIAGATFWTLVYPVDVIKSHVQTPSADLRKNGYSHYVKQIYTQYGIRGFFRGLGPTILRSVPVNGTSVMVYEIVKKFLKDTV